MNRKAIFIASFLLFTFLSYCQTALQNAYSRQNISLNGTWQVIVDPFNAGAGNWKPVWKDQHPAGKNDFYEYAFTDKITLDVPGDWNHQKPGLLYYESTIWYKKTFTVKPMAGKKYFLYFGAVNYQCDVYVNSQYAGSHEGGFTPFQFDITGEIKDTNSVIVRVNNQRKPDNIPAMNYDWWNYGGITRDVMLIETPATYISDYCIGLAKNANDIYKCVLWVNYIFTDEGAFFQSVGHFIRLSR